MHLPPNAPGFQLGVPIQVFSPRYIRDIPQPDATFTWSARPDSTLNTGKIIFVTDVGQFGSYWYSHGPRWVPLYPVPLARDTVQLTSPNATTEYTFATITIPAAVMGLYGSLHIDTTYSYTSSANNKTLRHRFSGGGGTAFLDKTETTNVVTRAVTTIINRGAANSQIGVQAASSGGFGGNSTAPPTAAVDTTAATTIVITGQKAVGTETLILERYSVFLHA